jgi:hypothetical protein
MYALITNPSGACGLHRWLHFRRDGRPRDCDCTYIFCNGRLRRTARISDKSIHRQLFPVTRLLRVFVDASFPDMEGACP